MLTVSTEERASLEDVADHWWLNTTCTSNTASDLSTPPAKTHHSLSSRAARDGKRRHTLPKKSRTETPAARHLDSTRCSPSTPLFVRPTLPSHSQLAKLPRKGILKKLYESDDHPPEHSGAGQKDVWRDTESSAGDGRKRKGILKRNGMFSSLDPPSNTGPNHRTPIRGGVCDTSRSADQAEEEELEIEISAWKT